MDLNTTTKIYRYLDGSGNEYIFNNKFIEYNPVKPFFSSSGVYNGGNYRKKEITKLQYSQLTSSLNKAMNNKKSHIKNRVKMSGIIVIKDKNEENACILSPDAKEKQDIEKLFSSIISL